MMASNVRIAALIKILVQKAAQGHQFVDVEISEGNVMRVFPALTPLPLKTLEQDAADNSTPLDDDIIAQLI